MKSLVHLVVAPLLAILSSVAAAQALPADGPDDQPDEDATDADDVATESQPTEAAPADVPDDDAQPADVTRADAQRVAVPTADVEEWKRELPDVPMNPPAHRRVVQMTDTDTPLGSGGAARLTGARALSSAASSSYPDDKYYVYGGRRSSSAAFALSGGATLAGVTMLVIAADSRANEGRTDISLVVGGLLAVAVGPTLGHVYAGNTWNTGLQVRLASLGIAALGAGIGLSACPPSGTSCDEGVASIGGLVVLGAGITYVGATLFEIMDAPEAADRFNMKHRSSLAVVPAAAGKPGVSIVGAF